MGRLNREMLARGCLIFAGVSLALIFSELALRFIAPSKILPNSFRLQQPQITRFTPIDGILPGVRGAKTLTINAQGLRGDEFREDQSQHILAIGGSTTACTYLDDHEAWPYRAQKILNQQGHSVWIGNAGVNGKSLKHHISDLIGLMNRFKKIDAVIVLVGVNDLSLGLMNTLDGDRGAGINARAQPNRLFDYKESALWGLGRRLKHRFYSDPSMSQYESGEIYRVWRQNRRRSVLVDDVPSDIQDKLKLYRNQLNGLIDVIEQKNARPIFFTQPVIWRNDLTDYEKDMLWFGWAGKDKETSGSYYTVRVLSYLMDQFNSALLEVCEKRQVECVDLARLLPKDLSVFYDDCHFNENGSDKVARIVASYLSDTVF